MTTILNLFPLFYFVFLSLPLFRSDLLSELVSFSLKFIYHVEVS